LLFAIDYPPVANVKERVENPLLYLSVFNNTNYTTSKSFLQELFQILSHFRKHFSARKKFFKKFFKKMQKTFAFSRIMCYNNRRNRKFNPLI